MKKAKEDWLEQQCKEIDYDLSRGINSKKAYTTLKLITNSSSRKTSIIKDKTGTPLADDKAKMERWTEYCKELYNYSINPDIPLLQTNTLANKEVTILPILKSEVEYAIKKLKNGKSPGIDNVSSELIKEGGQVLTKLLTDLCQKILSTNKWPDAWTTSLIIPLPKKGDQRIVKIIEQSV